LEGENLRDGFVSIIDMVIGQHDPLKNTKICILYF
jgi:hypothetical protein